MVSQIIKTLALLVLLVVFAITMGAYASDGATAPVLILAALVGLFILNWLGTRSWMLIILLPPVMGYLPLGKLAVLDPGYLTAAGVLVYWFILYAMGQAKFTWRGLFVIDAFIFLIFAYFVSSFIRNPVGIAMLSIETEYVGGKEYATCLLATAFYLTISVIPITRENLTVAMKWAMILAAASSIFSTTRSVESSGLASTIEGAETTRFGMLVGLGLTIVALSLSYASPVRILLTWWRSCLVIMGILMILLSGFREYLGRIGMAFVISSFIYKQFIMALIVGVACYACVLFLSNEKIILHFPHGVQRALSILPGVEIEQEIQTGADHSREWRYEMWAWAEDPRLGYIKNYTWGDGFGLSVDYLRMQKIRQNRGQLQAGEQEFFAETGTWHSGRLVFIHRLGYVGLYLFATASVFCCFFLVRTCMIYRHHPIFPYFMFASFWTIPNLFITFFSVGRPDKVFTEYYIFGLAKVLYCMAKENGEVRPLLFGKKDYVPLLIKEQKPAH